MSVSLKRAQVGDYVISKANGDYGVIIKSAHKICETDDGYYVTIKWDDMCNTHLAGIFFWDDKLIVCKTKKELLGCVLKYA